MSHRLETRLRAQPSPATRGYTLVRLFAVFIFLLSPFCGRPSFAEDSPPAKNVLILFSFSERSLFPAVELIETTVRSRSLAPVNFYIEYLESQRLENPGYEENLLTTFTRVYTSRKPDVLIAQTMPAVSFALKLRKRISPSLPIVFFDADPRWFAGRPLPPGVTGITFALAIRDTMDLVLRFHPDTKNVAVVTGNSEYEQYWLKAFHDDLQSYREKVTFTDIVGRPSAKLLQRVLALPPKSVVFFSLMPQESEAPVLGRNAILTLVSQEFPTYCIHSPRICIGGGGIGGSFPDIREQRVKAGELTARILNGEKPENIPILQDSGARPYLDWRQLHRWNIPDSAIPPGSVVLYREPGAWQHYKWFIVGAIALIVVQALLIIGLIWQRTWRRKIEASLGESEKRFRLMADTAPALIWMSDQNGKYTYLNGKWQEFTGSEPQDGLGEDYAAYIHPDDVEAVVKAVTSGSPDKGRFTREYRLRAGDGKYRWIFDIAAPRFLIDGSFAGFIVSAIDITEQKLAHEELATIGGKLIEAQEKERSRIARELHDDICQRLAVLAIELDRSLKPAEPLPAPTERRRSEMERINRIKQASENCKGIAHTVQALSHELHSSSLDFLGLVPALRDFCREFSLQHQVEVKFTTADVSHPLPREISLCVLRVVQEGLRNAVKHSGANYFQVSLRGTGDGIELHVCDEGAGFTPETAQAKGGLGLVSMRERVQLVKGTMRIDAKPGRGAKITVNIPLSRQVHAQSA